ncbi:MAG: TetR family transcriptional regulator [Firmicutes bacterium HGW-Firmicutes-16]|nr:MAG: TetR family transcriptional regulator [Firmicutes bacterium HGW-Firmicutes-16]
MIDKFMNLDEEKRERIINAALEEFAKKGYDNASTNEIVKSANISKGLLFHYFGSKKGLFLFLVDYVINIFVDGFYSRINFDETDILKRWGQIALLKIELIQKHPDLYGFLLTSFSDDSKEIKKDVENIDKSVVVDAYEKLLVNIDTSVFKNDMDAKKVMEIIIWVTQGFGNSIMEKLKMDPNFKSTFDMSSAVAEFDGYMKLLRCAFYK